MCILGSIRGADGAIRTTLLLFCLVFSRILGANVSGSSECILSRSGANRAGSYRDCTRVLGNQVAKILLERCQGPCSRKLTRERKHALDESGNTNKQARRRVPDSKRQPQDEPKSICSRVDGWMPVNGA